VLEKNFINKLIDLKYAYRPDIRNKESLEQNFLQKFEELNQVKLSDSEFARLLETIITADVFESARALREINTFEREDGTPLQYTLVNIKDWCKNSFEVINQFKINTNNSYSTIQIKYITLN
jgi:type I restriction enzyme R subunit